MDSYLWLTDPDADPALFVSDLHFKTPTTNNFFPLILFMLFLFDGIFTSFFKTVKIKVFVHFFACWWKDSYPDTEYCSQLVVSKFRHNWEDRKGRSRLAKIGSTCTLSELPCKCIYAMSTIQWINPVYNSFCMVIHTIEHCCLFAGWEIQKCAKICADRSRQWRQERRFRLSTFCTVFQFPTPRWKNSVSQKNGNHEQKLWSIPA